MSEYEITEALLILEQWAGSFVLDHQQFVNSDEYDQADAHRRGFRAGQAHVAQQFREYIADVRNGGGGGQGQGQGQEMVLQ